MLMFYKLTDWLRVGYTRAVNSISFYPAIISLSLGVLGLIAYFFRQNILDKKLMELAPFFNNADPDSLRTLMNVVTVGSISISVFSFSMVMVVLSQAANTYSPKVLDGLIKNKKPQRILGFYIGTVVFCLPQLLLIGEAYERSISPTAVLVALSLAVLNMFFFIEFIDYISRSVKPAQICRNIHKRVVNRLKTENEKKELKEGALFVSNYKDLNYNWKPLRASKSGYFQGLDFEGLFDLCEEHNMTVKLTYVQGSYILKNATLLHYHVEQEGEDLTEELHRHFVFHDIEDIDQNAFFGFRELADIATKAMSPGVNDIGTARISVDLLIDLIGYFARCTIKKAIVNQEDKLRIILKPHNLSDLVQRCLDEIRIYSKDDKSMVECLFTGCAGLLESMQSAQNLVAEVSAFVRRLHKDVQQSDRLSLDVDYFEKLFKSKLVPLLDSAK